MSWPLNKTMPVPSWDDWKELADKYDFDPYEEIEFGLDAGGGDGYYWEYTGDVPEGGA